MNSFKPREPQARTALREPVQRAIIILAAALLTLIPSARAMAIEEPFHETILTEGKFELRKYASYLVAETLVEGEFETVGNEAFRRLAGYIGGKNKATQKIAMTAPVSQESMPEKIAMTAPVSQVAEGGRWKIAFMMPSNYTLESLPIPDDQRVKLREEQEKTVAVVRYSGSWGKKRYQDHESKLLEWISGKGWEVAGAPIWARYNPPFMPWFLRRNEILVPVEVQ